jgi:branched-chain amino acid transport system permease protein
VSDRARRYLGFALALGVALALPRVLYPVLALDIVLWGLFAVAVDLLLGFGGLLSFGHAAFWGSAGYAAGVAARQAHLPFPLAVAAGVAVSSALALPLGYLAVRRKGIYFAMVTLAFAQMVYYVANEWRTVTGGENGLQGIPRTLPGLSLSDPTTFYYAALPFALLGYWLAYRVVHSPFGHVLVAIRDNEARAQALGYPTRRYLLLAFVISAGLAGLAGSLFALGHGFAALELVHWTTSGTVVMMVILGGIGTLWGSVVGALLVVLLRDWLSSWTDAWGVVTGTIFVAIVLGFRRGLWGTLAGLLASRRLARLTRGRAPAEAPPEAPSPGPLAAAARAPWTEASDE